MYPRFGSASSKPTSEEARLTLEVERLKAQVESHRKATTNTDPPKPDFKLKVPSELDDWKKKCLRYYNLHSTDFPVTKIIYALERTVQIDELESDLLDVNFLGGLYDSDSPTSGTRREGLIDWVESQLVTELELVAFEAFLFLCDFDGDFNRNSLPHTTQKFERLWKKVSSLDMEQLKGMLFLKAAVPNLDRGEVNAVKRGLACSVSGRTAYNFDKVRRLLKTECSDGVADLEKSNTLPKDTAAVVEEALAFQRQVSGNNASKPGPDAPCLNCGEPSHWITDCKKQVNPKLVKEFLKLRKEHVNLKKQKNKPKGSGKGTKVDDETHVADGETSESSSPDSASETSDPESGSDDETEDSEESASEEAKKNKKEKKQSKEVEDANAVAQELSSDYGSDGELKINLDDSDTSSSDSESE
jgi:hypothetical protein